MKKVGIFGGSFDPIHNGHIAIAESAYRDIFLDEVWFVPAGHSPNKNETQMTDALLRAEMTELAVKDIPYFKMSAVELETSEISYTYLTLSKLKERFPNTKLYFLMGADSLDYFEKWYHPERICKAAALLVAVRNEFDGQAVSEKIRHIHTLFSAEIYPLSCEKTDISSSQVRTRIKNGESVLELIPEQVCQYIGTHHLYE